MNKLVNKLTAWPTAKIITLFEHFRYLCLKVYVWINTLDFGPGPGAPIDVPMHINLPKRNVIIMHFWVSPKDLGKFEVFGGFIKPGIDFKRHEDCEAYLSIKPVLMTKSQAASATKRFRKFMGADRSEFLRRYTLNL